MNSTLLILIGLLSFGYQAGAAQLLLDSRMDYASSTPNEAAGAGYQAFQVTRLKLDYQGSLGDLNSFRVRIDPLNANTTSTSRDRTSKFVDFAYLTRKLSDSVSFSMGKIISGMGGTEGSVNPGDVYQRSVAGNEIGMIYWPVGAQLDGAWDIHRLRLNVANNTEDVQRGSATGPLNQTKNLYGLVYTSKLLEGTLIPNVSFHTEDFIGTTGIKKTNSYLAAGAKTLLGSFEVEADHLGNKYDLDPQAATNVLETKSSMALVRYNIEGLGSAQAKLELTDQKKATGTSSSSTTKITATTAAFEYKPSRDENWRMHLAYTLRDTKPEIGDTQSERVAYVGMRILADFLR